MEFERNFTVNLQRNSHRKDYNYNNIIRGFEIYEEIIIIII